MRIGGLASGIDTESIIKDLMKAERIPLDKVTQKKQYFEWQLNDYRTANRDLKDFSTKLFDNVILSKNFSAKNVSISDPNAVSIKSKGNTEDFSGTIKVDQLATNAATQGTKAIENNFTLKADAEITIKAPGKEVGPLTFKAGDSLDSILKEITEKTGVRAFYDSETGNIALSAKQSGILKGKATETDTDIVVSGSLANQLGLDNTKFQTGQDAKFTYNGLTTTRNTNTFELDGMEITLKAKSENPITFNATTDTDKVFDTVKSFVDDYNKLIEDLNKKIREPKYRNFQPLSTEQKADMKEKEIELWEEKAMSGTLRNDPELTNLLSTMRNILTGSVKIGEIGEGTAKTDVKISLSSIGITTSKDYLDHGKLVIDETKLKEAISKNPSDVHKLFANEVKEGDENQNNQGLARKLRTAVDATQESIKKSAGRVGDSNKAFSLGRTLDAMNKQIENFESRMQMVESRYWKQFNAMENAIQRANSQSASLMSALGGGA